MNPRIEKLRLALEKNRTKIAKLQEANQKMEKKLTELENLEIIGTVRESGMELDEFLALFGKKKEAKPNEKNL